MTLRLLVAAVLLAMLAACSSRPDGGALVPTLAAAPGATDHAILVASMRERAEGPQVFSGERADKLDFAAAIVSVPPTTSPARSNGRRVSRPAIPGRISSPVRSATSTAKPPSRPG